MKTEAETGLIWLQAKECQGMSAVTESCERGMEWILSQNLRRKSGPADSTIMDFCLQNCERINYYCVKSSSVGYCYSSRMEQIRF